MTARRSVPAGLALLVFCAAGCESGGRNYRGPRVQTVSILRSANPWLNMDAVRDEKPEGIQFRIFLIPQNEHRGVLVPGTFIVDMYYRGRDAQGEVSREKITTFNAPTRTLPHKRHPTTLGQYYVMRLSWAPHDVLEREVEFIVSYEDPAGRKTFGQPIRIIVPKEVF